MSRAFARLLGDLSVSRASQVFIDDVARARTPRLVPKGGDWFLARAGLVEMSVKSEEAELLIRMGAHDHRRRR